MIENHTKINGAVDPAMQEFLSAASKGKDEALKFIESTTTREERNEWHKFDTRQGAIVKAMAKPLPGAAGDAFISGPINIAGKAVKKITPAIWMLLQAINSPILRMFEEAVSSGASRVDWTEPQKWDACWIFTEDTRRLESLMESQGASAVSKEAKDVVSHDWEEAQIDLVMAAIVEQILRHAQTKVRYVKEASEKGDVRFFRDAAPS